MSLNNYIIFAFTAILAPAMSFGKAPSKAQCHSFVRVQGKANALQRVSVYDGNVEENVDLVPAQQGSGNSRVDMWDLDGVSQAGSPIYLVCIYRNNVKRVIAVPKQAKMCKFSVSLKFAKCQ